MSASTAVVTAHEEPLATGHATGGISNPILGMILFICSEVMFFAGLFAAYFNVRNTSPVWPPAASPTSVPVDHARACRTVQPPRRAVVRARPDDPPRHQLVHLPARRLGDPAG